MLRSDRARLVVLFVLAFVAVILDAGMAYATTGPEVIGHRGRHYPAAVTNENTLAALRWDHQHRVSCETDTWRLADPAGHPNAGPSVIFHDNTLGRVVSPDSLTAAGLTPRTYIGDVTPDQFALLRTKGGKRLPTLEQWITKAKAWGVPCLVELKWGLDDPAAYAALGWVSWYQQPRDTCSTHPIDVLAAYGAHVGIKESRACPVGPEAGYDLIALYHPTARDVDAYHDAGWQVGPLYADSVKRWRQAIRLGCDFLIAPDPGAVQKWMRGRR